MIAAVSACVSAPVRAPDEPVGPGYAASRPFYASVRNPGALEELGAELAPGLDFSDMGVDCFDLTGGLLPEAKLSTCRVRLTAGDKVEVVFGKQRNDGGYEPSPEVRTSITRMMSTVERVEYRRPDPARAGDAGEVIFHINPHSLSGPYDDGGEDLQAVLFDVTPRDPGYGPGRATFAWYFNREPNLQPVPAEVVEAAEADGRKTKVARDE